MEASAATSVPHHLTEYILTLKISYSSIKALATQGGKCNQLASLLRYLPAF